MNTQKKTARQLAIKVTKPPDYPMFKNHLFVYLKYINMLVVIGSEQNSDHYVMEKIINNKTYKQERFVGLENPEIGLSVNLHVCNTVMA